MTAQPTLLVFTLGPSREQARRHLLPEPLNAVEREFHQSCLESILDAGRECEWQIAVSSPEPVAPAADAVHVEQSGGTFGGRFRRAFQEALETTGGPVIAVGSDSPGLQSSHLRDAAAALAEDPDRVVLGPSVDGGFYLLAASRPLDRELREVRWRSRKTLKTLLSHLAASGREVVLLAPLEDLDRPHDLTRWVARTEGVDRRWRGMIALLRGSLADLCAQPLGRKTSLPSRDFVTPSSGRAPPQLAA